VRQALCRHGSHEIWGNRRASAAPTNPPPTVNEAGDDSAAELHFCCVCGAFLAGDSRTRSTAKVGAGTSAATATEPRTITRSRWGGSDQQRGGDTHRVAHRCNNVMMTLLQARAAEIAGVVGLVLHIGDSSRDTWEGRGPKYSLGSRCLWLDCHPRVGTGRASKVEVKVKLTISSFSAFRWLAVRPLGRVDGRSDLAPTCQGEGDSLVERDHSATQQAADPESVLLSGRQTAASDVPRSRGFELN
jgi:hypothetical protein